MARLSGRGCVMRRVIELCGYWLVFMGIVASILMGTGVFWGMLKSGAGHDGATSSALGALLLAGPPPIILGLVMARFAQTKGA